MRKITSLIKKILSKYGFNNLIISFELNTEIMYLNKSLKHENYKS